MVDIVEVTSDSEDGQQEECHPGQRRREGQAHLHEQTFVVMDDGLGNTAEPGDSLGGLQAALTDSDEDEFYDAQSQNENSESGAADLLADIAADVAGEAAAAVGSNDEHSSRDDDDGFVIVDSPVGNESTEFRQLEEDLRESRSCSSSSSSREYSTGFQAPGPAVKGDSSCDADIGAVSTSLHGEGVQEARKEVSPLLEKVPELSCEEKKAMLEVSEALKAEGNRLFGALQFVDAAAKYSEAVEAGPPGEPELAVYFANRAACMLKLGEHKDAVSDCNQALQLQPEYVKALMRRSSAYEKLDDLEGAIADAQKVLELESNNQTAAAAVKRLEPIVAERREKLKEEMIGKLKDLGNMVLGNFGLSCDNFQMVQDPETGGYSFNFKQ